MMICKKMQLAENLSGTKDCKIWTQKKTKFTKSLVNMQTKPDGLKRQVRELILCDPYIQKTCYL